MLRVMVRARGISEEQTKVRPGLQLLREGRGDKRQKQIIVELARNDVRASA